MVDFMDPASLVLTVVHEIYSIVDKVQSFKHRSKTLKRRIEVLTPAIDKLATSKNNEFVNKAARSEQGIKLFSQALGELLNLLTKIRDFLMTFTESNLVNKVLHSKKIEKQFDEFSEQLDALVKDTHFTLHVEMREVMYSRLKQDEEDNMKDLKYLGNITVSSKELKELKEGQEQIIKLIEETNAKQSAKSDYLALEFGDNKVKKIEERELEKKEQLSDGTIGTVYKALYMKEPVALKVFPKEMNLDKELLRKEAENLIRLESKHVVRMWGVCTTSRPYMIVMEYMERGNLRHVLDVTEPSRLPCHKRIQMALDGALGLYRIHHMPRAMLHLDLASHKFLVNANWEVKISDVGLAKTRTSIEKQSKRSRGSASSTCYICPKHLEDVNLAPDEYMEVYSYGIIMWEIATGLRPYKDKSSKEIEDFVIKEKEKLPFPTTVSNEGFKKLIDKCRNYDPLERPTSGDIVDALKDLRTALGESMGVIL